MDEEIPKSELPKPFRKLSIRVNKSHLPGNASYKGSVVWQRTLSIDDIGSPDKPGGLSIQLCKSEKKEFYIRYSS